MKTNIKKLNRILKYTSLKPEMFYTCSATGYTVSFQGAYTPDTALALKNLEFRQCIGPVGDLKFTRGNIEITLT